MKSDRKQTILFIIILLVLSMGIGYAFLTTTLNIDGTSDIDSASWDVHFENVQVANWSVEGSQVITPATINSNKTSISYHVDLKKPNDCYEFIVEAVNAGTIDAMIDDISIYINGSEDNELPNYLVFDYSYFEIENKPQQYDLLRSTETIMYDFLLFYNSDIGVADLPTSNESYNVTISITYSQATSNAREVGYYVYSTNQGYKIGDYCPSGSFNIESINVSNREGFYRYLVRNNIIYGTDLVIKYDGDYYYLYGVRKTSNLYKNVYFNKNKNTLFLLSNEESCMTMDGGISCGVGFSYMSISANGAVHYSDGDEVIGVDETGKSTWNCIQC